MQCVSILSVSKCVPLRFVRDIDRQIQTQTHAQVTVRSKGGAQWSGDISTLGRIFRGNIGPPLSEQRQPPSPTDWQRTQAPPVAGSYKYKRVSPEPESSERQAFYRTCRCYARVQV